MERYMDAVIELVVQTLDENKGGPFGAIIVKDNEVVATGINKVTSSNDPTAHAEVVAIRQACDKLGTFDLSGCVIYSSCEPCLMCLGAIYWAHLDKIVYGATREDAAGAGFDDQFIYEEVNQDLHDRRVPIEGCKRDAAKELFKLWDQKLDKIPY
jgi:tRNA(Arg) A34 adenosine deaminase TadA